jgi:hypothetical protein
MRCETARERIQDWFDSASATAMPPDIGAHVHECAECKGFIQRWNRIEVSMQSMRTESPGPSPAFRSSLQARLDSIPARRPRLQDLPIARMFRPVRYALAMASVVLIIALAAHFAGSIRLALSGPSRQPIVVLNGPHTYHSGDASVDGSSR